MRFGSFWGAKKGDSPEMKMTFLAKNAILGAILDPGGFWRVPKMTFLGSSTPPHFIGFFESLIPQVNLRKILDHIMGCKAPVGSTFETWLKYMG